MNKKGMQTITIILLIVSLITLIIFSFFVKTSFDDFNYKQSILSCSLTFNNIAGKNNFFDNGAINNNLIESLSFNCPYKNYDDATIKNVVDLVIACYDKTSKGNNIFSAGIRGETMCLYCGSLRFDEPINNFDEKFIHEIKKRKIDLINSSTKNLNELFLYNKNFLPKTINSDEVLNINYYTRYILNTNKAKKSGDFLENENSAIKKELNSDSFFAKEIFNPSVSFMYDSINFFSDANLEFVVTGISLSKSEYQNIDTKDFSQEEILKFKSDTNKDLIVNCGNNLIIPYKMFN